MNTALAPVRTAATTSAALIPVLAPTLVAVAVAPLVAAASALSAPIQPVFGRPSVVASDLPTRA
jgi:hypothetical protein